MSRHIVSRSILSVGALLALCSVDVHAATLRVPSQYPSIQAAIDASRSGDVVLVAPGTYSEHLQMFDKGVLTLESEAGAESTIIDGGAGAKFVVHVSSPLRNQERLIRIAGFTIRNGQNGIYVRDGHAEIENNIVTGIGGNVRGIYHGAIYAYGAAGFIKHNTVVGNNTYGIDLRAPHGMLVEGNVVAHNGWTGMLVESPYRQGSSATILRNFFDGNTEHGLFIIGPLDVRIADNLVSRNDVDSDSIYFNGGSDGPITGSVVNNTVVAINAPMPLVSFVGNVDGLQFANNVVYNMGDQPALNCGSFDSHPMLHHDDAFATQGAPVSGYCVAQYANGKGNVSVDPRFDPGAGLAAWQLAPDSPLIDAGSNHAAGILHHDILGRPRILDGGHGPVVDMGAYEYRPR